MNFQKIVCFLSIWAVALPVAAQGGLSAVSRSAAKVGGAQLSRQMAGSLVRPLPAAVTGANLTGLQHNVQQALTQAAKQTYSVEQISKLVRSGYLSPDLVAVSLSLPNTPAQAALLRNEILTVSTKNQNVISSAQLQEALRILRTDLNFLLVGIKDLNKYQTVEEVAAAFSTDKSVRFALQAVGDVSAIGLYGSSQDNELLFRFYEILKDSPLEPLALTAAVRACVSVHAGATLDAILAQAPRTRTYKQLVTWLSQERLPVRVAQKTGPIIPVDLSPLTSPLVSQSRVAGLHIDASARSSKAYLSLRVHPQIQAPVVLPETEEALELPAYEQFRGPTLSPEPVDVSAPPMPELSSAEMLPMPESGVYVPTFPQEGEFARVNFITKQYPSGLQDEARLINDWLDAYKKGYFHPRDQIEAIRGMSAAKANNLVEYLLPLTQEEARDIILKPLERYRRLPDFMYDARLIPGTKRLPPGYYKNKFNDNVKTLIELAEEDNSVFTRNVQLKDLVTSMEDYSFEQGFAYQNDPAMSEALRRHWQVIVNEVLQHGVNANRHLMNAMWRKPIKLANGQKISLRLYFTQKSGSSFFKDPRMPEFYLNSPKWRAWENERRNLAARDYMYQMAQTSSRPRSWWEKVQDFFILGKRSAYLTLEQFGKIMTDQYRRTYEEAWHEAKEHDLLDDPTDGPSTCTVKINNFDKPGGVCQAAFGDGGYMGKVPQGYDGTSTVSRFTPVEFKDVPVVGFDFATLQPQVITLNSVPYLKDLKQPDGKKLHASIMVRDGLDITRDLLSVQEAENALFKIPHLKATIYPHSRLKEYKGVVPPFMDGGGLAGYLALFTPDFYPIKKVMRLRFEDGHLKWVPEYFVRKEVPTLAGLVHRDYLTFTYMLYGRVAGQNGNIPPAEDAATK